MLQRHLLWLTTAPILLALLVALALAEPVASVASPWIGVRGNHLVDGSGKTVRLLGVNRSGAEYQCVEGDQIFDGPTDWASIKAMKSWKINAVRVPLNESCWLGINGVAPSLGGSAYRAAIREYVSGLERAGLYVILDLHWAAPRHGRRTRTRILPQPRHRIPRRPRRHLRPLQRAPRHHLGMLVGPLHQLRHLLRRLSQRRPAGTAGRGALDRRGTAGDAGWPRLVPRHARLAGPPAQGPGARPDRRQPHLRVLGLRPALPQSPPQHLPPRPRRHQRAGGERLQPSVHRPLHGLGRPPRHLLPGLDLGHRQRLDLRRRDGPDRQLRRPADPVRNRLPRTPAATRGGLVAAEQKLAQEPEDGLGAAYFDAGNLQGVVAELGPSARDRARALEAGGAGCLCDPLVEVAVGIGKGRHRPADDRFQDQAAAPDLPAEAGGRPVGEGAVVAGVATQLDARLLQPLDLFRGENGPVGEQALVGPVVGLAELAADQEDRRREAVTARGGWGG